MTLSVLTITNRQHPFVENFLAYNASIAKKLNAEFVVAYDKCNNLNIDYNNYKYLIINNKNNIIEDSLNYVHKKCSGKYVLRLDDDEILDDEAVDWIGSWLHSPKYRRIGFNRYNLWQNEGMFIENIYPDIQVRLMLRHCENRTRIHQGLDHDIISKGNILHFKFLVKDYRARLSTSKIYENCMVGAGFGEYAIYNIPETINNIQTKSINYNSLTKFNYRCGLSMDFK